MPPQPQQPEPEQLEPILEQSLLVLQDIQQALETIVVQNNEYNTEPVLETILLKINELIEMKKDRVRVRLPDGRIGTIPVEQLPQAISSGAEQL